MELKKYRENIIYIVILTAVCFFVFFSGAANYPFLDLFTESKSAAIAKDMLDNGNWQDIRFGEEIFKGLQPLYFWLVNLSCIIFGKISTETVRFPMTITAVFAAFLLYSGLKSILTKTSAFIASMIFISSLGILVFAKIASNSILFAVYSAAAVLFGYKALLIKKHTAFSYFCFYFFSALSVLTSGIAGFLPILYVLLIHIIGFRKKALFRPKNLFLGLIIFLIIVLPYNINMYQEYGLNYLKESLNAYILPKFEFSKLILLFAAAFFPWFFAPDFGFLKSYIKKDAPRLMDRWKKLKRPEQFLFCNMIVFAAGLIPAVLYGAEYPEFILFLIFPASCITGLSRYRYITKLKNQKMIFISGMIINIILIICSLAGLVLYYINSEPYSQLNNILRPLIVLFFTAPAVSILALLVKGRTVPFIADVILAAGLAIVLQQGGFNYISSETGENDLILFAEAADRDNASLAAYIKDRKYSIEYYYDKPVEYIYNLDMKELSEYLNKNPDTYIAVSLKDMLKLEAEGVKYTLLTSGRHYCLIKAEEVIKEEEPEEETYDEFLDSSLIRRSRDFEQDESFDEINSENGEEAEETAEAGENV